MKDGLSYLKNIMILCEGLWSLGENAGVTSLGRLISVLSKKDNVILLSPDKENIICYKKIHICHLKLDMKNRYLSYLGGVLQWILYNIACIYYGCTIKEKPNIIYVSSSLPAISGYILSLYYKVPYIQRQYGTFLRKKLNSRIEKIKSFQEVLSYKLPATKFIITDDGTYGDEVAEYFGISNEKVLFWRNGIDRPDFSKQNEIRNYIRKANRLDEKDIVVLAVSRLVHWKRVDRIIEAFNRIKKDNIKLIVIGDGSERKILESLSKNKNVLFLGAITNDKVKEYMLACDIFVSMYDLTNIGNPLLEALSAGMAIVTLDNGDTPSMSNGKNMIMLSSKDESLIINDLSKEICNLSINQIKRKLLGENARVYAENNLLSWEERINKEVGIIASMYEKFF